MKELLEIISRRPKLFEKSPGNIWDGDYVSKSMLKAHLDENLDSATRKIEFVKKSVEWISETLPPQQYPALLDLGCGPGIYTELFYGKGYRVSGIDLSGRSIAYAKDESCKKNMEISYSQGDYIKTKLGAEYNLITLIYCDFGVLSGQDRGILLSKIYDALSPNGIFLFDVFTPLKYAGIEESRQWDIGENGFWRQELCLSLQSFYRYDEDNSVMNQYVIVTKEAISFYNVWEHTFTLDELKKDLAKAGFRSVQVFGNTAGKPYEASDQTMCIVAQK